MKKWKIVVITVLCFVMAAVTFSSVTMPAYAYTQEEKQMVKDWLSANGYSPTMSGLEQAYRDYLNGKWGPVGGNDEKEEQPAEETTVAETVMETEVQEAVPVEVETSEEEITEVIESTETVEETLSETEALMESEEESLRELEVTETTVVESESETVQESLEEQTTQTEAESLINVGRYDGIIVVVAMVACVAMIGFTVRYIKKSKKDGM